MKEAKKVKHIEVDLDVHTSLKTKASAKGMKLKEYVRYLDEKEK